jgi:DNA-directed RNA polymerase alpha subunit
MQRKENNDERKIDRKIKIAIEIMEIPVQIEVEIDNLVLSPDPNLKGFYSATFDFKSVDPIKNPYQARAFRLLEKRFSDILHKEIPTDAIDRVEVYLNETDLVDELLAHKMGLIPLRRVPDSTAGNETFEVYVEAPADNYVFSASDLVSTKGRLEPCVDLPLGVLKKGQKLQLRAHTKTALGEEHSKFRPTLNVRATPPEKGQNVYKYRLEFNCQLDPVQVITYALNQTIAPYLLAEAEQ